MKKESKSVKKCSFYSVLDIVTDAFVNVIKKVNKFLTDKKKSVGVRLIIRMICCLVMLAILKIPFLIVGELGEIIINFLGLTFNELVSDIWSETIDYAWLISSLVIIFKVICDVSKRKDYKIEVKESTKIGDDLYSAVGLLFKIIIAISLIPLMLVALLLFALFGMLICLITHGIYIIGPIIMVIGLLIMAVTSLSYVSDIVFFGKGGNK